MIKRNIIPVLWGCGFAMLFGSCVLKETRCTVIDKHISGDSQGVIYYHVAFNCDSAGIITKDLTPSEYYRLKIGDKCTVKY